MGHTTNHPEPIQTSDIQSMKTFIGMLAHEIRAQLAAISVTNSILLSNQKMEENERAEYLTYISSTSYYLLHVLDNMMDTAKFSKGKLELTPIYSRFHFSIWLASLIKQFDLMIEVASVKILVNISNNVPEYIVTDPVKLGQILHNLISNAIKSTLPSTSITLNVSLLNDKELSFQVTDQGGGIPEDKLPLLFQPFRQLEKGRAGTGLGLYITKLCVTALGGEIAVYSQNGGTVFKFFIILQASNPFAA